MRPRHVTCLQLQDGLDMVGPKIFDPVGLCRRTSMVLWTRTGLRLNGALEFQPHKIRLPVCNRKRDVRNELYLEIGCLR